VTGATSAFAGALSVTFVSGSATLASATTAARSREHAPSNKTIVAKRTSAA
jgi:hypothetical protein